MTDERTAGRQSRARRWKLGKSLGATVTGSANVTEMVLSSSWKRRIM